MEGAVRRLRLLLLFISIFVFQGQCAVPEIGKRHPQWGFPKIPTVPKVPEIPNIPKVDPVPAPNIPKVDPAPVPDLPEIDPIPNSGSNGPSPLGAYIDNSHREPFADLTGEWDQFFSRVDDILEAAAADGAADGKKPGGVGGRPPYGWPAGSPSVVTNTITNFCSPVVGGGCTTIPTYITVFDPAQPTNACSAWSSLSVYCRGSGLKCACFSSSYYVPDQWNLLAAACAKAGAGCPSLPALSTNPAFSPVPPPPPLSIHPPQSFATPVYFQPPLTVQAPSPLTLLRPLSTALKAENTSTSSWCDLVYSASSYASYCPTNGLPTVAFAAVTPAPTTAAPSSLPTSSVAIAIKVPKFKILTLGLFLVLSASRIW